METHEKKNEEITMSAVDETDLDPEVCCGLLLSQIGYEWAYCPFCGGALDHTKSEWVILG